MTVSNNAHIPQTWQQRVFQADKIWQELERILKTHTLKLDETPRLPDLRLIVNNISGETLNFLNPGQHSNTLETIRSAGDLASENNTAAMIMLAGDTLEAQQNNAAYLVEKFNLGENGLSPEFVKFIGTDEAKKYLKEAYGPAPFEGQSKKLVPLEWQQFCDEPPLSLAPVLKDACAYGVRAPSNETVFIAKVDVHVKGTDSIPETMEMEGMAIAVSKGQDGTTKTRPIVPSVAKTFYGRHYNNIPVVTLSADGDIQKIHFPKRGDIEVKPDGTSYIAAAKLADVSAQPPAFKFN